MERRRAINTAPPGDVYAAMALVGELELEDLERRHVARRAGRPRLPQPQAEAVPERGSRPQLNIRLSRRQLGELEEAAALLGASRTALARVFVVDGTRRVLRERDGPAGQP